MKGFFNQILRINLPRTFNQQEGVTKKEGRLPRRFFREVLRDTGTTIQPEDLKVMLREYYRSTTNEGVGGRLFT